MSFTRKGTITTDSFGLPFPSALLVGTTHLVTAKGTECRGWAQGLVLETYTPLKPAMSNYNVSIRNMTGYPGISHRPLKVKIAFPNFTYLLWQNIPDGIMFPPCILNLLKVY